VDDNSPDGTSAAVKTLADQNPNDIFLITRFTGKSGRGSAVLEGFRWALSRDFDPILEMDADFSHDPAELPRLLEASRTADVVVGSRYLPKSTIVNWPLRRRIFSRLANKLAHFVLKLPLSDYTNGYRAYRREALSHLNFDDIPEKGYIVLSYVAAQMASMGYTFAEVPTLFVNRQRGASQLSRREIFSAFRGIMNVKKHIKTH
jgi:dolichol-phosphate mannosyltransferase